MGVSEESSRETRYSPRVVWGSVLAYLFIDHGCVAQRTQSRRDLPSQVGENHGRTQLLPDLLLFKFLIRIIRLYAISERFTVHVRHPSSRLSLASQKAEGPWL